MIPSETMAKKREVLDYIVANKLNKEEAAKYAEEEGVLIRTMSFTQATTPEEFEAGQRFVGTPSETDLQEE